jgi:hypothetical protein
MISETPELIEVFMEVVAAMNGSDTLDYKRQLIQAGGTTLNKEVSLTEYLSFVVGDNFNGVQFYPAHPLEIITTLQGKDESSFKYEKYPAVCLLFDTRERIGYKPFAMQANGLQFLFIHYTEQEYTSAQRHEYNFKPILLPMYYEFMYQVSRSKYIANTISDTIPRDKINRYFWARDENQTANPFNDKLDAIELQNLQLNFNFKNCL